MYNFWIVAIIVALVIVSLIISIVKKFGSHDWYDFYGKVVLLVFSVCEILVMIACIFEPMATKSKILEFENTREIIETTVSNGEDYDNFGVTQKVIEANLWLAEAKANKEVYGNWSSYWFVDFEKIKPIQATK